MILLIDNYDSFSYNLYQLIGSVEPNIKVIRNDGCSISDIENMNPSAIVISPGPGRPEDAGICIDVIKYFKDKKPILGVCLGHQAICEALGGKVGYAKELMHGKQKLAIQKEDSILFQGIDDKFPVARYHSLSADPETIPDELVVTSISENGEIMSLEHVDYPIYGLQFHPESVMTPDGYQIIKNFMEVVK